MRVFVAIAIVVVLVSAASVLAPDFRRARYLEELVLSCVDLDSSVWVTHFSLASSSAGLGIVASRDMKEGEALVELPYSLHVNPTFARPYLPSSIVHSSGLDPQIFTALYVAMERFHALPRTAPPAWYSRWWYSISGTKPFRTVLPAFADMMPAFVPNAAHWSDADFEEARAQLWPSSWRPFPFVHNLTVAWRQIQHVPWTALTEKQFRWGYSMLLSRSFKDLEGGSVMLPVADLMNHAFDANVAVRVERRSIITLDVTDPLMFYVSRNVSKGTELTYNYGNKTNLEMMMMYGFVVPNNPSDAYPIVLSEEHVANKDRWSLVTKLWGKQPQLMITWDSVSPSGLLSLLSADTLSSIQALRFFNSKSSSPWNKTLQRICDVELKKKKKGQQLLLPVHRQREAMLRRCATRV